MSATTWAADDGAAIAQGTGRRHSGADNDPRVRAKLKLSQRDAGALFKVGENAFDKYERGLIEPSGPTIQLMTLLDKHPELVDELR